MYAGPCAGGSLPLEATTSHTLPSLFLRLEILHVASSLCLVAGDAARGWSLTAMGYDAEWLATDQIPRRAVEEGLIDRFGLIDPGPRGLTDRYSLSAEAHRGTASTLQSLEVYIVSYDFALWSNFTYLLEFAEGDQFEQRDERLDDVAPVCAHRRARRYHGAGETLQVVAQAFSFLSRTMQREAQP